MAVRVAVFTLGGTIAMMPGETLSGRQLLDAVQLVPGAGAHRAEHRDGADAVVAGVVRHHVRDERLVGRAAGNQPHRSGR
jgi:hypothetical protein